MTLRTRYSNVEDNEYLVLATLLDPQFKGKFFSGAIERSASKQMLEDKMKWLLQDNQSSEPLLKRPRSESVFSHLAKF